MADKNKAGQKIERLVPLDLLRGLIMVLMALDHANYFVAQKHPSGEYWGGPFPAYDEPLTFLTRFVTHLCAPGFFFLMGIGMMLFADSRRRRGWSQWRITGHLILRGGLLIALQFLLVNRAWELSPGRWGLDYYYGVLFALGGGMILCSSLLSLKPKYLLGIALVLVFAAELATPGPPGWNQGHTLLQRIALIPGGDYQHWINYPVLQWVELIVFGMAFGGWLREAPQKILRQSWKLGTGFLLLFVALRYLDGFGNLRPRMGNSWINFLNVVKYPPSITFTLLTMGLNLLLLSWLSSLREKLQGTHNPLVVFGRVPLFFYTLHLFLYAGMMLLFTSGGTSLPAMYPYWLLGLLMLYPLCLWYGDLKHRQPPNSILRFF